MADEPLGSVIRREVRRRHLGFQAECRCGERDALLLQRTSEGIECSRCEALRTTGKTNELHHPAGRANSSLAVLIDANLHALFTDAQYDWPPETLANRHRRPARRLAALLRALLDLVRIGGPVLTAELEPLVVWLEQRDVELDEKD